MRPVYQTLTITAPVIASPIVVDIYKTPVNATITVTQSSATQTSKLQYSNDDPWASYATDYNTNATWIDAVAAIATGTLTLVTTASSYTAFLIAPVRAVRINFTAGTAGTANIAFVPAGNMAA